MAIACKKTDNPTPVSPDLEKYFSYKRGTYWIYKDPVTGESDSFAVVRNTTEEIEDNNGGHNVETASVLAYNNDTLIKAGWQWLLNGNVVSFDYRGMHGMAKFIYPFENIGTVFASGGDTNYVEQVYPTYTLSGNLFNEVALMYHTARQGGSFNDTFFISKDVGMVKMKMSIVNDSINKVYNPGVDSFNANWELQRYHIVH
jgi:hypothetical protein